MKTWHLIFLSTALLLSCSKDNFKKYVELGDLRVLAIIADNGGRAEGSPGDSFNVSAYVSDLNSVGAISATAVACVDPGISYGAEPSCDGNPTAITLAAGGAVAPFSDLMPVVVVNIPAAILLGHSAIDQFNGVNYLLVYTVTNSIGQMVKAIKRIPISDSAKVGKNSNPVIAQILANNSALGALASGTAVELSAQAGAASAEAYSYYTSSGQLSSGQETLQATWFYSDGELKYYRTLGNQSTTYTAPATYPSSRSSFIVTVLRDGRGGEAVQKTVIH